MQIVDYETTAQAQGIVISRRFLRGSITSTSTPGFQEPAELASIFFQASLLPYLLFLYFLNFRQNLTPPLANFGFQFLLVFVVATAVAGVMAQTIFNASLANVDWIHGSAESVLTISNILIVIGFKDAISRPYPSIYPGIFIAFVLSLLLGCFVTFGVVSGFKEHSHFLWGIGNVQESLPWAVRREPENALSIATWTIHLMSVIEYIVAMNLVWRYAEATGNPKWRGLTWGMLPMHASSICAVTHHFFYNNPELILLVTFQAFLTMLGNTTTMVAAYRIAKSNGWNVRNTILCCRLSGNHQECARQLTLTEGPTSNSTLLIKLTCFTVLLSYGIKYGELALLFPGKACTSISLEMVVGIPLMTAIYFIHRSYSDVPQHGELVQRNNNDVADVSEDFHTSREVDDGNDEEEESPLLGHSSVSKNNGTFSLPSSYVSDRRAIITFYSRDTARRFSNCLSCQAC